MHRRGFFKSLLGCLLIPTGVKAEVPTRHLLLQQSPLAGFHYYDAVRVWAALAVGDPLALKREPQNRGDARAVAVYWRGHKLGYLPRLENTAAAQLMDRGQRLQASIAALDAQGGPWDRIRLAVYLAALHARVSGLDRARSICLYPMAPQPDALLG